MSLSNSELWQRLSDAGLVTGAMPPTEGSSPWYVRVMLGVAGWIGACFLLGFVGAGFAFIIRSETAALIVGLLACAAGYGMFRAAAGKDFAVQFALTGILSVAAATLLLAASFPARGVAATILIMLVGFANGNRPLLGLGLLGLTGFVAYYYYQMQTTLLVKSMVLFGIGMALLLLRAAMQYLLPEREEETHA